MSAAGPDVFDRLAERLGERVGPIVVKEVRQGLRTKAFSIFFTLMLVACLVIALVAFGFNQNNETGEAAFNAFYAVLAVVQFLIIPFSAHRSMAREQEDETWVLLTLTGLGPRSVIRGKIGSFILQGLLYASATAPFLLFSYYLNGIGLPAIVFALAFAAAFHVFLISASVSLATVANGKIIRSVLLVTVLGALIVALFMGIAAAAGAQAYFERTGGDRMLYLTCASVVLAMLTTGFLLFESAAAGLSLITEDYARGPRIAYLTQLICALGVAIVTWQVMGSNTPLIAASLGIAFYSVVAGSFVTADLDGLMPSLHAKRSSVFTPGAYRGYLLVVVSLLVTEAVLISLVTASDADGYTWAAKVMLGASAFSLLYISLPQLIARGLPHQRLQVAVMVRIVALAFLILGCGLPPLIGLLVGDGAHPLINALNPIVALKNMADDTTPAPLEGVPYAAALLSSLAALTVLKRRDA